MDAAAMSLKKWIRVMFCASPRCEFICNHPDGPVTNIPFSQYEYEHGDVIMEHVDGGTHFRALAKVSIVTGA